MKSLEEIKALIIKLEGERTELLSDYEKTNDNNEQNYLSAVLVERAICIKHLKWVIGEW